jgi:putative ABC transport system permease protein
VALLHRVRVRVRAIFRPARVEQDLHDELHSHLGLHIDELISQGMEPEAARAEAMRAFSGLAQAEEACRDARGVRVFAELAQDLRYALRMVRRTPVPAAVIVLTLAVAIGANTALFSIFDAVLLKALPLPHPDRLVVITEETPTVRGGPASYPDFLDWRARQTTFEDLAVSMVIGGVLTGDGEAERVFGRAVSREFFSTLGSGLAIGRTFNDAENRPNGERAIILSHALWQRRHGGNPNVLGRPVLYNGEPYTIVAVLPATFDFYGTTNVNNDIFLPIARQANLPYMQKRDSHPGLATVGRMKPGVTLAQANADLSRIAAELAAAYPSTNAQVGVAVRSLLDDYVGDVRQMLWVLLASAMLVLTIACANIANLLLARSGARAREVAMRLALGAGRWRIIRQLLTENLLLAVAGGSLGVVLGRWGTTALSSVASRTLPRMDDTALDWRVLGFTLAATVLAGLFFGLLPAWQTARVDDQTALKDGGRSVSSCGHRHRDALVFAEIALSLALLVGAGLLLRSFTRLVQVDPGYDARGVLTLRLRFPDAQYRDASRTASTLQDMLTRIASLPGVDGATLTTGVPFGRTFPDRFAIAGLPALPVQQTPLAWTQWVTAGYFDTLRIGLIAGRTFTAADAENSALVAVVDEEFARLHFPGRGPAGAIGERLMFPQTDERWRTIVGIVRHVRHNALDERTRPEAYGPYEQLAPAWKAEIGRAMDVAVRSSVEPAALVESIKTQVHAVDPGVPLSHVRTLAEATSLWMAPRVLNLSLVGGFSAAALLLCLVGIYGLMSYSVAERTREIGLRLALGASPRSVLALLLTRGLSLALAGAALGIFMAVIMGRSLEAMLYSVSRRDPATFAAVTVLLVAVVLVGSYFPARRAMRVDPLLALRHE